MYDFDSEEENLGDDLDDALSSATLDDDLNAAFDDENEDEVDSENDLQVRKRKRKEEEADYEVEGRARWKKAPPKPAEDVEVGRLPIKLPTGEVQKVEGFTRIALPSVKRAPEESEDEKEDEEEDEEADEEEEGDAERMAGQKGRFGRMGIAEIVGQKGWKNAQRLEAAKEQLAAIGAEILAGGELVDNVSCPMSVTDARGHFSREYQPLLSPLYHHSKMDRSFLYPRRFVASLCYHSLPCIRISFRDTAFDS